MDFSLRVYDLATGKEMSVCERPVAVPENVWAKWRARGVKFSPDGKLLVAHETTPDLGIWDAETGNSVAWLVPDVRIPLASYTFTGPQTVVAAYGSGDLIRVWDAEKQPRRGIRAGVHLSTDRLDKPQQLAVVTIEGTNRSWICSKVANDKPPHPTATPPAKTESNAKKLLRIVLLVPSMI